MTAGGRASRSLQVGLVGTGPWGKHILRDLRALGATVHCVARSEASIARARGGGAASIVSDPRDLPSGCNGYVIANRTTSHLDAVEALLARGKPIFCEKPLGNDPDRILRLPPEAHDLVFIMHKWRYHPGILELGRIAQSRAFGDVTGLRTLRVGWTDLHPDVSPIWTLMPHDLSIALAILGDIPQLAFTAADPLGADAHGCIAHMTTASGVPVVAEVSARHPVRFRRVLLGCTDAVCALDSSDYGTIVVHERRTGDERRIDVDTTMPLEAELEAFLRHLEGGPPPLSPLSEEIEMVGQIAAMERSVARQPI